jgi:predicted AlkP superfamily phosphohydrolase/phosphomutase
VPHGTFLSGLGVPDMRGRVGTPSIYTSRPQDPEAANEFSIELFEIPSRGRVNTEIFGPENLPFYRFKLEAAADAAARASASPLAAMREAERGLKAKGVPEIISIPLTLDIGDTELTLETSGNRVTLRPGEWSEWLVLNFPFNPLFSASGIVRFKLVELEPEVHLYMSPVNLNPADLPVFAKISHPRSFAKELAEKIGLFKTMGWSIDTWSLQDEHIDEETFLEDVAESVREFRLMFDDFIQDEEVTLFTQIFYFTDRVQHMIWRLRDHEHPYYDEALAERYERAILDSYKTMDEIVGEALEHVDERTHLLVVSDHGFSTWRRAVNLNTWLVRNGFMTLTSDEAVTQDLEALFGQGDLWPNVDWSRTQAFALGLGYVRLNVLGREPEGTVLPGAEYERVRQEIIRGLEAFVDEETGLHPVSKVYTREEMYRPGFDTDLIPDLRVCNNVGYRVSWQSSLGNTPPDILYDVEKKWSGDHCSLDPKHVKGVLYASFPLEREDPWIGDVFPTICDMIGLPQPDGLHGRSLVAR